jgi:hypothetical protein
VTFTLLVFTVAMTAKSAVSSNKRLYTIVTRLWSGLPGYQDLISSKFRKVFFFLQNSDSLLGPTGFRSGRYWVSVSPAV